MAGTHAEHRRTNTLERRFSAASSRRPARSVLHADEERYLGAARMGPKEVNEPPIDFVRRFVLNPVADVGKPVDV